MTESIINLAAALAKFQGLVKNPPKTKEAKVPLKNGGSYSYKYADLGVILDTIREPLAKCGLSFFQAPVNNERGELEGVQTILMHESGEHIVFEPVMIKAGSGATAQQVGSALTYARRYSLCLALGIVADEDDDAQAATNGNGSAGKQPAPTRKQEKQPTKQTAGAKAEKESETVPFQQRRFFAVVGKRKLTDKQCKALVFGMTGKRSRKELREEEYQVLADFLEKASAGDIKKVIDEAAATFVAQAGGEAQ